MTAPIANFASVKAASNKLYMACPTIKLPARLTLKCHRTFLGMLAMLSTVSKIVKTTTKIVVLLLKN